MNIGHAIKHARTQLGLTQMELSERSGIAQTSISQFESEARNPSKRTIKRICKALEIPEAILYVLGMEPDDVPKPRKDSFQQLYPAIKDFALQILGNKSSKLKLGKEIKK